MTTYLLDANVLIALTVVEHEHHDRAARWAAGVDRFALCPVVEGALVRFLLRLGESITAATALLRAVHDLPHCEFWPDSRSYLDAELDHIHGHRQVTDAYLAALATSRDGRLVTLDDGLAKELPGAVVTVPLDAD